MGKSTFWFQVIDFRVLWEDIDWIMAKTVSTLVQLYSQDFCVQLSKNFSSKKLCKQKDENKGFSSKTFGDLSC